MPKLSNAEILVMEANTQAILFKAYEEYKKTECIENGTLLPLAVTSYQMCQLLFLNNYDINTIYEPYLKLWSLEPKYCYIPLARMVEIFPLAYKGVIKMFFKESDVMYEDFFIMSCCFIFFDNKHLLLLLLSMSQIFSNVFISRKQINEFFATYDLEREKYSNLLDFLNVSAKESNCPDNMYYMKDFLYYFNTSEDFCSYLNSFRDFLINFTVKEDNYKVITKRMDFFYDHISLFDDKKKVKVPKESCVSKTIRKLFTSKPHPYHYDYFTVNHRDKAFDDMLFLIRQAFGYSCRNSSFREDNAVYNAKHSAKSERSEKSILSGNGSVVGGRFQKFRAKPSKSSGYPAINLQTISINTPTAFPASTKHRYSCSSKHFFPKRDLSKNKILPEEESEKRVE